MADEDQTLMERFGGFSRQPAVRQLALLVGLAASVALAIGLVQWAMAPGMKPLFSQLNPADTNIVISTLEANGIEYEINAGGSVVAVPQGDLDRARLLLASEGLPKGDGIGFESLYQEQELGLSSFMEQARYHRALEAELARTMAALDSVRSARVHLAIAKESPFLRKNAPAASVMLNIYPGRILSDRQLAGIVHLVSSSVPNLDASQVSVVDQAGKLLSDQGEDVAMGSSKEHYRLTQQLEQDYSDRIVMILEPILGAGSVRAQVSADMDFTRIERTSEVYAPDTVVRSEQVSEEIANTPVEGGAPGELVNEAPVDPALQQQPEGDQVAQQPPARTSTSSTRNYEMDKTISHIQETPGSVRRLSVAVLLDYAENVGDDGQVTRAPLEQAQLDEIRTLVSEAIGFTADRGDTLSIMNAEFMRPPAPEPLPEPGFFEQDWVWQAGKGLLALSVLLALVFVVLRPLMRFAAVPIPPAPQMMQQNQLAGPEGQAGGQMMLASGEPVGLPENMNQGANYLQSLSMARQAAGGEPARAASVMKNWVAADG